MHSTHSPNCVNRCNAVPSATISDFAVGWGCGSSDVLSNTAERRKMKNGDTLKVRTVSWPPLDETATSTCASIRSTSTISATSTRRSISYEVVGGQRIVRHDIHRWTLDGDPASIEVSAKTHLVTTFIIRRSHVSRRPLRPTMARIRPSRSASEFRRTRLNTWVDIGQTWPYGSNKGSMKSSTCHAFSVGAAASASGVYGDWELSGSTSAESGITFTWPSQSRTASTARSTDTASSSSCVPGKVETGRRTTRS